MEKELKKIIEPLDDEPILYLHTLEGDYPIFLKKRGNLAGMIVKEDGKWVAKIGGAFDISGAHLTRKSCIKNALHYGYKAYAYDPNE